MNGSKIEGGSFNPEEPIEKKIESEKKIYEIPIEKELNEIIQILKQNADANILDKLRILRDCGKISMNLDQAISNALKNLEEEAEIEKKRETYEKELEKDASLSDYEKIKKSAQFYRQNMPQEIELHDFRNKLGYKGKLLRYNRIDRVLENVSDTEEYDPKDESWFRERLKEQFYEDKDIDFNKIIADLEETRDRAKQDPLLSVSSGRIDQEVYNNMVKIVNEEYMKLKEQKKKEKD